MDKNRFFFRLSFFNFPFKGFFSFVNPSSDFFYSYQQYIIAIFSLIKKIRCGEV